MRIKWMLLLVCLWLPISFVLAQDVIKTTNGQELQVRIKAVTNSEVIYHPFPDTTAAEQRIAMDQVQFLKLEKGADPALFQELDKSQFSILTASPEQLRLQGKADARRLYKGRGAMWGTFAATTLFPPAGLLTGTLVAISPPEIHKLPTNTALMKDPIYQEAFKKQARNRKLSRTATGFVAGIGGAYLFYVGLFSLAILLSGGL